ncbi:TPA: glycine-rich domain-containing protein [Raoultella planticola]
MALSLLANNNAKSVLAAGVSASATVITVATGSGALFPIPVSGQSFFKLTIIDAATKIISEIVHVTSVTGDVMTVIRGQEGTPARVWSTNDIVANMMTAGTLNSMLQKSNSLSEIKEAGLSAMASARSNIGVSDSSGYVGRLVNVQRFNASGTYTRTAGATKGLVEVVGAGGGGGGARATNSGYLAGGAGGGGGGYASGFITLPETQSVVVGVGGAGGVDSGAAENGGASSFGAISATGGGAGASSGLDQSASGDIRQQTGGWPGVGSGGNLVNSYGGTGKNLLLTTSGNSCAGAGGESHFGGGPRGQVGASGDGSAGAYGSGGSGAMSDGSPSASYSGGAGGNGIVIVWEYA